MKNSNKATATSAVKYKNRMTGDEYVADVMKTKFIDGIEFMYLSSYNQGSVNARYGWVRKDNLERVR